MYAKEQSQHQIKKKLVNFMWKKEKKTMTNRTLARASGPLDQGGGVGHNDIRCPERTCN